MCPACIASTAAALAAAGSAGGFVSLCLARLRKTLRPKSPAPTDNIQEN
jgi:hypothetical protein